MGSHYVIAFYLLYTQLNFGNFPILGYRHSKELWWLIFTKKEEISEDTKTKHSTCSECETVRQCTLNKTSARYI